MISDLRRTTFNVAWEIQRMMYGPDFWVCMEDWLAKRIKHPGKGHQLMENCVLRSDSAKPELRINCEPTIISHDHLGRIFSREGLAVIFMDGFPTWMETPWGEWWCWEKRGPGGRFERHASLNYQALFLEKVLTEEPADLHHGHYRIRQFGATPLPRQEGIGIGKIDTEEIATRQAEWITLCQEMNPPRFPHWYKYVEADVPLPGEHPEYDHAQKIFAPYRAGQMGDQLFGTYALKHHPTP